MTGPARPAPAPVDPAPAPDSVEEAAATVPTTESADLVPTYRPELNVREMGWFFDDGRSNTRKRLAYSPEAIRAGFEPGLPHLKQLCLAMHSQVNLVQCSKAAWPDSLQVNVGAGPAKKMDTQAD